MVRKAFGLGQNLGNPRIYGGGGDRGTGAGEGDRSREVLGNPERSAAPSRARGQRAVQEKDGSGLAGWAEARGWGAGGREKVETQMHIFFF